MSSKLKPGVHYVYMSGGATWERLRVKADMVLFPDNAVWSISERIRGICEDALYKSTLPLRSPLWVRLQTIPLHNSGPVFTHIGRTASTKFQIIFCLQSCVNVTVASTFVRITLAGCASNLTNCFCFNSLLFRRFSDFVECMHTN